MIDELLERFRQGDRRALSRLLSLVAQGEQLPEILPAITSTSKASRIVAITGSAGVGKSTLVGKLIDVVRHQGKSVAVLACDPRSPVSGGALLGDRVRMPAHTDDGVFIRSLATAGGQGAVAEHLAAMLRLLESFGFDVILIETVGAGQGDTVVRDLADVVVLLLQPETGDDLQWEKAGVLEVADIVAVHKGDLPGADFAVTHVRAALGLSAGREVPVLKVSAKKDEGIEQLWTAIEQCPPRRISHLDNGFELLRLAQATLTRRFTDAEAAQDPTLRQIVGQWRQGTRDSAESAAALLRFLGSQVPSA